MEPWHWRQKTGSRGTESLPGFGEASRSIRRLRRVQGRPRTVDGPALVAYHRACRNSSRPETRTRTDRLLLRDMTRWAAHGPLLVLGFLTACSPEPASSWEWTPEEDAGNDASEASSDVADANLDQSSPSDPWVRIVFPSIAAPNTGALPMDRHLVRRVSGADSRSLQVCHERCPHRRSFLVEHRRFPDRRLNRVDHAPAG